MKFPNTMNNMDSIIKEVSLEILRVNEQNILGQLNDFVSRGLIVIEQTTPVFTHDFATNQIQISQSVKLTLKDKEYIEQLEKENKEIRTLLEHIRGVI